MSTSPAARRGSSAPSRTSRRRGNPSTAAPRSSTNGNSDGDRETTATASTDDSGRSDDADARLPVIAKPAPAFAPEAILRYDEIPNELGEALRSIINRSELRSGHRLPKAIAVTSSLPGEGVTTVSQALATLIAQEMGSFVCWVDCNWLTSSEAGDRQSGRPSLVDILADQSRILSAFQASSELPQLMSLAPGPVPESKRNMIVRSPEFEHLLGVLADEFDHVVFDVPPILTNANGLALLRRADASLLVVKHRSTTMDQVQRAIEATEPTPNLGVVLNRYRSSIPNRLRRLLVG